MEDTRSCHSNSLLEPLPPQQLPFHASLLSNIWENSRHLLWWDCGVGRHHVGHIGFFAASLFRRKVVWSSLSLRQRSEHFSIFAQLHSAYPEKVPFRLSINFVLACVFGNRLSIWQKKDSKNSANMLHKQCAFHELIHLQFRNSQVATFLQACLGMIWSKVWRAFHGNVLIFRVFFFSFLPKNPALRVANSSTQRDRLKKTKPALSSHIGTWKDQR